MTMEYDGMSAILYARVSTDDKGQTTETQVRAGKEWCARNGVTLKNIYEEERSGKDQDRPKLREAKGRISERDVNILLARDESRLSRSTEDMEEISAYCKMFGCVIRYFNSSSRPEDGAGYLINALNTWQASEERKKLVANTISGMQTAKLRGVHCGRMLAFCFADRVAENERKIQKDGPHRTVIVTKDMVLDYARQGMGISRSAELLGVSATTLKDAMKAEGILEGYRSSYLEARKTVKQGDAGTRGDKEG